MGVASAEDPAPRAVAWGWRGRARRWAGRGNREERAGPVCSCPCLALGRGRASARAGGKPARTAVVGFDWRGGEVTCERCTRRVRIAPASRGPTHPARLGPRSRQSPRPESATRRRRSRTLGAAARTRAGRYHGGRDAPGGGGLGREKRNFAGACPRGPGPAVARGGVGPGGGGRRHVGVCGKRGARAAPLRAGARAGTASVPPRRSAGRRPEGRDRERRLGTWTSRRPSKLWGARTQVPRSCGLKTWQGLGVRGTLCPSGVFYTTLYENGTTQVGSDREQWLTRYLEFFFFKFYDLLTSFFFF